MSYSYHTDSTPKTTYLNLNLGWSVLGIGIFGYQAIKNATQTLFGSDTLNTRYTYLQKAWQGDDNTVSERYDNLAKMIFGSSGFTERKDSLLRASVAGTVTLLLGYDLYSTIINARADESTLTDKKNGICEYDPKSHAVPTFEKGTPRWILESQRILDLVGSGVDKNTSKIHYADIDIGFDSVTCAQSTYLIRVAPKVACPRGYQLVKDILDLSSVTPTTAEGKTAYNKLAKVLHPDKVSNDVTNDWLTKMKAGGEYKVNREITTEAFQIVTAARKALQVFNAC